MLNIPSDSVLSGKIDYDSMGIIGYSQGGAGAICAVTFKPVEFDGFRKEAGLHAFTMSPSKWIESVNAIGITTKAGRYGGTYAHSDIALEFASWISAEFKLYIVKDYQRIKHDENSRLSLNWNLNREVAKLNYRIHTDAIKANLIPPDLTPEQISYYQSL